MIQPEELKEDLIVFDSDCPQFGEGLIVACEDDMVDVRYQDIEETVNYSKRDALKYLNILGS